MSCKFSIRPRVMASRRKDGAVRKILQSFLNTLSFREIVTKVNWKLEVVLQSCSLLLKLFYNSTNSNNTRRSLSSFTYPIAYLAGISIITCNASFLSLSLSSPVSNTT